MQLFSKGCVYVSKQGHATLQGGVILCSYILNSLYGKVRVSDGNYGYLWIWNHILCTLFIIFLQLLYIWWILKVYQVAYSCTPEQACFNKATWYLVLNFRTATNWKNFITLIFFTTFRNFKALLHQMRYLQSIVTTVI